MVVSVCICGPSPTHIGGWEIITHPWGDDSRYENVHLETGQRVKGVGALYHRRFMIAVGVPYETLDKRAWVWTAWDTRTDPFTKLDSWEDPRPYPYPEAARRRGGEAAMAGLICIHPGGREEILAWCEGNILVYDALLTEVGEAFLRRGHNLADLPRVNVYLPHEWFRCGDRDEAIPLMRAAVDHLFREGQLLGWGVPATGILVETLLGRGADGDVVEAEAAIDRLAAAPADEGLAIREIWLLRLRALLARARGDEESYRDYRDRYRDMARTLGFEGHIAWAEAMP
jgi:hypothetical protein